MTTARLVLEGIGRRYGALEAVAGLSLTVARGEVVCLLGPSGCGKSTTLRIAAGVERQSAGRVLIDGREMASHKTFVPPEARGIGLMFQDYALFPHLSVAQNVAFGLAKWPAAIREARVRAILTQVQLEHFARAYPATLSGGEQQRVALARALAPQPGVMLMDEPFSNLDVPRRNVIRDETWALLKDMGTATLLVTHEPKEAMRMADRIALMRAGRIVQAGPPDEIYNCPVDAKAAAFFSDLNVFRGRVASGRVETPLGTVEANGWEDGANVEVMVRPHVVRLTAPETPGSTRATVQRSVLLGPESLIEAETEPTGHTGSYLVRALVPGTVLPKRGTAISLAVDGRDFFVFAQPA